MPTMELQLFLRQQVEENPLLETEESPEEEFDAPPEDVKSQDDPAPNGPDLDEEWLAHWRQGSSEEDPDDGDGSGPRMEQGLAKPQSLHESLRLQLGCHPLSEEERRLGETLINSLDEYGYLDEPLDELAAALGVGREALEAVLKIIQRFDPPGVGARDLRECLMLQLEQNDACGSLACRILQDHFPLFVQHRLTAIASATGSSIQQVETACDRLKRLNPKPGRLFTSDLPPSIVPDLVIHRRERHDDVELNDQELPQVGINHTYYRMLKDPRTPEEAKGFLLKKFRQASWLMKAIDERNTTLLAIGRCLISLQRDFVEHGSRALKPLTQAQVAELIGRHPSTVSRAISGKTIDTPYGIFRLEQLFASGVPQFRSGHRPERSRTDGVPQAEATGDVSDAKIKSEIQRLISEEDAQHPCSDEVLVRQLAQRNISVARRTIAKYRTSLKILPAHLRRRRL